MDVEIVEDVEIYYYKTEIKVFIRSSKLPKGIIPEWVMDIIIPNENYWNLCTTPSGLLPRTWFFHTPTTAKPDTLSDKNLSNTGLRNRRNC